MIKERKDTAFLRAKREERGSDYVNNGLIVITDANGGFVVLKQRPTISGVYTVKDIKYFGKVDFSNGMIHKCTCRSFYHGNVEEFLATHAENFVCKHIAGTYLIHNAGRPNEPRILA